MFVLLSALDPAIARNTAEAMDYSRSYQAIEGSRSRMEGKIYENRRGGETEYAQLVRRERIRQSDCWVGSNPHSLEHLQAATNCLDSNRKHLNDLLNRRRCGIYAGVDPTGPSLHIGHVVPFMALGWLYIHGYSTHFLVSIVPLFFYLGSQAG